MSSPWVSRDCCVPGCTLEADRYRDRCREHLRDREELAELLRTYAPIVRNVCATYSHPTLDSDDIEEVGMLALWEAARRFKLRHGVPFARFLTIVLSLRLRDAGVKAARHKNAIVSSAVRVLATSDGGQLDVLEFVAHPAPGPERCAIAREALWNVIHDMNFVLTPAERTAMRGILNERSYDDIAAELGGDRRTVDNAVQRARRKLAHAIA